MSKREISIVLKAKNELAVGLAQAKSAISDFGESAMRIGKLFAGAFLAAGTAIAGFATKALSAYSQQETATRSLEGALRAYGDEVDVNSQRIQNMAAAIQDETGIADENLVARAARLRMLGVETSVMDNALRATVALSAVGMEEEAAIKAVAQAREGNYMSLGKYIPAIRAATTEEEKAAILQDFIARGYSQQREVLDTLGGQWNALKGRVGDAWEEFGRAIAQNDTIKASLESAGEAVKAFGLRVREWVDAGGVENATAQIKFFGEYATYYFMLVSNTAHLAFSTLGDTLAIPFRYAVGVINGFVNVNIAAFQYIVDFAAATYAKIKNPFSDFKPPDTAGILAAFSGMVDALAATEIRKNNLTKDALAVREELHREHAARIAQISEEQLDALERQNKRSLEQDRINAAASISMAQSVAQSKINIATSTEEVVNETLQRTKNVESEIKRQIDDINKSSAESVKNNWQEAYRAISDSSIDSANVSIESANRIAKATSSMANTGFNTGLTGKTFELGGGGADYNQAVANLKRQGFQIGGMASQGTRIAGISDIVAELQRIRQQNDQLLTFS